MTQASQRAASVVRIVVNLFLLVDVHDDGSSYSRYPFFAVAIFSCQDVDCLMDAKINWSVIFQKIHGVDLPRRLTDCVVQSRKFEVECSLCLSIIKGPHCSDSKFHDVTPRVGIQLRLFFTPPPVISRFECCGRYRTSYV